MKKSNKYLKKLTLRLMFGHTECIDFILPFMIAFSSFVYPVVEPGTNTLVVCIPIGIIFLSVGIWAFKMDYDFSKQIVLDYLSKERLKQQESDEYGTDTSTFD